jgi:hypothetical protein
MPESSSCALSGHDCLKGRSTLEDGMSMLMIGKRLCDIAGWVVVALLPLLVAKIYNDATRFACYGPSHTKTAQKDMETLTQVSEMYKLQHGHFPGSCAQLLAADLVQKCTLDPWGTEYQLFVVHDGRPSIGVRSAGKDKDHGTLDDIFPDSLELTEPAKFGGRHGPR